MVKRICPTCRKAWYSSYEEGAWVCANCGGYLWPELNENAENEKAAVQSGNPKEPYPDYISQIISNLKGGCKHE